MRLPNERESEGTGSDITAAEQTFDTTLCLNINNSDIDPEMTDPRTSGRFHANGFESGVV
jgi:hypothetical protein